MRRATGNQSSRVVNFSGLHLIIAELELKTILAHIANHKVLAIWILYLREHEDISEWRSLHLLTITRLSSIKCYRRVQA